MEGTACCNDREPHRFGARKPTLPSVTLDILCEFLYAEFEKDDDSYVVLPTEMVLGHGKVMTSRKVCNLQDQLRCFGKAVCGVSWRIRMSNVVRRTFFCIPHIDDLDFTVYSDDVTLSGDCKMIMNTVR